MRLALYLLWAAGFALLVGLIGYQGFGAVAHAVATAGWGVAAVVAYRALPLWADTLGWQALLPRPVRRPFLKLLWMRWIGDAVNMLLPVAQIGGELVRGRLLHRAGVAGPVAGASVVVDLTAAVLTQIAFSLIGAALLAQRRGAGDAALAIGVGIGLFSLLLVAFYLAQRAGLFESLARALERAARGAEWLSLVGSAAQLDRNVTRLYRRTRAFWISSAWHFLYWLLGVGESWLALHLLGYPATVLEALVLESLGSAVRAAAFAIPGALGVQEGGFLVLGSLLGIGGETTLALSLIKRMRELALGLPALASWHLAEGRSVLHRRAAERSQLSKP